jgi:small-conductance mechanosensitive channel
VEIRLIFCSILILASSAICAAQSTNHPADEIGTGGNPTLSHQSELNIPHTDSTVSTSKAGFIVGISFLVTAIIGTGATTYCFWKSAAITNHLPGGPLTFSQTLERENEITNANIYSAGGIACGVLAVALFTAGGIITFKAIEHGRKVRSYTGQIHIFPNSILFSMEY